jgi:seryl-tRNA synthetase
VIDLKLLRDDPDRVRASQRARGEDASLVDAVLDADERRRAAVFRYDTVRGDQKTLGKLVAAVAKGAAAEKQALLVRAKDLSAEVKEAEAELGVADDVLRLASMTLSNVVEEGAPEGGEADFTVLQTVGTARTFDFTPRDHVELGTLLGAIDTDRGAKVSGARFYFLTGVGALLEFALVNLAVAQAVEAGFTPMIVPALVRGESMEGTGFLGAHAAEVYRLADDDLYLVGTSEVALAGYHRDEILESGTLPRRYAGYSSCFRREAGSYGKDTRGIWRVHQFDKVEMFSYCPPEDALAEHRRLLAWEQEFLGKLELPYRVIDVASGDLGSSAARKFDCEAWIPSMNDYREVTSTSNCTTFQSRRLNIRMRDSDGVRPVATLNGTLCAITRTIVAILENHQQADGSVVVPVALRGYLGRDVLQPISR